MSLIKDIKEEVAQLKATPKVLRRFAWLMAVVFLIIASWQYFSGVAADDLLIWAGLAVVFLLLSFFPASNVLKQLHKAWMTLAFILGWFVSRFLLTLIFYLIMTPIGLLARLFGKELLDKKFPGEKTSFWEPYHRTESEHYEKMY